MSDIISDVVRVGGIRTTVYRSSVHGPTSVAVVFLIHGRHGSASDVDSFAKVLVTEANGTKLVNRKLIVVTLDHRNHGSRLLEPRDNNSWKEPDSNERHGIDMFSIQMGTAKDISFLADFLPAYLFPNDECQIDAWGVIGISLGGHSTWLALSQDSRIQVGVPIIGCPNYLALMERRAKKSSIPFAPPYLPESFIRHVKSVDPASKNYRSEDESNPFLGKKILVLSGQEDKLVPWVASQEFVESLVVGPHGVKKVVVAEGVGHKCTDEMITQAAQFVTEELCGNK